MSCYELKRAGEWQVVGEKMMEVILSCLNMSFPDGPWGRSPRKKNRMCFGQGSSGKAESSLLVTKTKIISKHMKRFRRI